MSEFKNLAVLTQQNLRGPAKITFYVQLHIITILFTARVLINTHTPKQSQKHKTLREQTWEEACVLIIENAQPHNVGKYRPRTCRLCEKNPVR